MVSNLVISGGPLHDFAATTAALVGTLDEVGVRSTVFDDPVAALRTLADRPDAWDLVTVNALHARLDAPRHAHLRARYAFALSDADAALLHQHVRGGGGLLACHTAVIGFDAHPRWRSCLGASWDWDRSHHPPAGPARIEPTQDGRRHPITAGIGGFDTVDEIYGFLDGDADLVPLLASDHGGATHPVLWTRQVGAGRVVVDLLGHDVAAMSHPVHREVLRRSVRWSTDADRSDAP